MGNNHRRAVLDDDDDEYHPQHREGVGVTGTTVEEIVESWVGGLADQVSVSASTVQDHLIDLWAALEEGETRREVERWLTETLERELYLVEDVVDRLVLLESVG
jgi:hypothetical protein